MNQDVFEFVIYMLHACAKKCHMPPYKLYELIEKEKCVSNFLVPLYDVLHTQSTDFVVNDIREYIKNRGVIL